LDESTAVALSVGTSEDTPFPSVLLKRKANNEVGLDEGRVSLGTNEGARLGYSLGSMDGLKLGQGVGLLLGAIDGYSLGGMLGCSLGLSLGGTLGKSLGN